MSDTDWKQSRNYCNRCGRWLSHITHKKCPRGESGSQVLLNIVSFREGCTKCGETWPLENGVLYCSCGNVQRTEYTDSVLVAGHDDKIIFEDDTLIYMLRSTGVVVAGQRRFPGIALNESPPMISTKNTSKKTNCFQVIGYLVAAIVVLGICSSLFQSITHTDNQKSAICVPQLTSVSSFAAQLTQTVLIQGSCLGTNNTFSTADSQYFRITDSQSNSSEWNACYTGDSPADLVTCGVSSWTNNSITFSGFSGDYGQNNWAVNSGDTLTIQIWNPQTGQGPGECKVVAGAAGTTQCNSGVQ